ncbi:antibiotic biosynthesis monooxygenase family protein [Burkholderia sp. Ac-20379]|uniref:antibiotic biosynthesis monooxygenase family protein n=1 Tax=Burkholderia sp. Ac-20379 TaxID=2703900 RepID=UPI00198143E2|nr:antibiotic biosynthesis monooxygenase [Burkholderia sp. Ac-20379]MBN3725883.1 antibiotic biosynthesis monooxygenase [Burkholderia sp. Ac-20379]
MYASTFIFRPGQYDAAFHRLDETIAEIARAIPGYLGEEAWQNADGTLIQNVYYWASEAALKQLIGHPAHLEAKQQQARWLDGYRVVIAQVLHQYGDGKLPMFGDAPAASASGEHAAG